MNNYFTSILFFFITYIGFSQSYQSKIDAVVSSTYSSKEPGISVLVAKDRKAIYSKAFGKSNLELNTPLETNSVFQIGSITKQFTAISILMLEEQGKLIKDRMAEFEATREAAITPPVAPTGIAAYKADTELS